MNVRTALYLTANSLLILIISISSAYAGCEFKKNGDYVCPQQNHNQTPVQNKGNPIPQPEPEIKATPLPIPQSTQSKSHIKERPKLNSLISSTNRLDEAFKNLPEYKKELLEEILFMYDIDYKDIADWDGPLIEGSGQDQTFMGIPLQY